MEQDPYRYFRIEAREILDQLGKSVLDLEKGVAPELVARLLRLAHTLKGAARVVKQREIADHAHAIEELLAPFRNTAGSIPRERIDALLAQVDGIAARMGGLDLPAAPVAAPVLPDEPLRTTHDGMGELDELLAGLGEAHVQLGQLRGDLAALARAKRVSERLTSLLAVQGQASVARDPLSEQARGLADELKTLIGDMERGCEPALERVERELSQARESAERLRLVPVHSVFTALERTVRDAAQALGRKVVFTGLGGDVRIDAQVLSTVQRALVQMVRNAVAHGIEPEHLRLAAGKPEQGRVVVEVLRRGRQVAFTCADDGRGVDLEAVRQLAQRKGLHNDGSTADLLRVLLAGGISTSHAVTEVAGRGIGLDVVRAAAEQLGGAVNIHTDAGAGTRVELVVPWSLAAVDALLIEAAGVVAAIPRDAVRRTLRVFDHDLSRAPDGDSIFHEGAALPFIALARVLSGRPQPARGSRPWSAFVVQAGARLVVVGVDRLLGTAQVVVHPLPTTAPAAAVVVGAAIDAEGDPLLVLDPDALIAEAGRSLVEPPEADAPPAVILVIDDSLTTRMLEQSILEAAGYEVDTAMSAEEGLEMARRRPYALILVDVEMPGMDGFTFIERIRADPALHHIPAMLVTSRAAAEDRRRGEVVGATAYIVKSEFDQGDLLARIRKLVG